MKSYWAAAWSASAQGPFPHGRETAQPDLTTVFPDPETGASDQSFRMIVRPDIWGTHARIRLSNAHGSRPVTFDGIYVGLHVMSGAILVGTNRPVHFNGSALITVAPGSWSVSDPVALDFIADPNDPMLAGRNLAVSFHVQGDSGPMTYHAKALQTSYISDRGAGSVGHEEIEGSFPTPTTSWFFLDAVDMNMAVKPRVVVAFGDSISDGSGSTINGHDRWPDVLSRRLHAKLGDFVSVVNQGIGGNQILGPPDGTPPEERLGGIPALARLERDVIGIAGVTTVMWLEGINDLGHARATADQIIDGVRQGVARLRDAIPGVRIIMGTLTTALNATTGGHGTKEVDTHRRAFNDFVRTSDLFDGVIDFDAVTLDRATGEMRPEMCPGSSIGGEGDRLHPNRIGYQAMAAAIDLDVIVGT
jgi:lysophospholipase L1-like esterase